MQEQRKHKRFKLNLVQAHGSMSLADKVEIMDISLSGMALKADRRLNIGKEYSIKLGEAGKTLDVRCIVVRSELSGIEPRAGGVSASIYSAGVIFKEGQADIVRIFLKSLEQTQQQKTCIQEDRRLNVRFCITAPRENVLSFPAHFTVKKVSLGGMLIETEQFLQKGSSAPMELALQAGESVKFIGRVASCLQIEKGEQPLFEIGVEFTGLGERDQASIKTFVDYIATLEK